MLSYSHKHREQNKKTNNKKMNGGFEKMRKAAQAKAAEDFVNAIKTIANKPENLDNLESYLSYHFAVWLERYANTPDNIAAEMREFAEMEI